MLRDVREYSELGVGLLLTLKMFLVQLPFVVFGYLQRLVVWYTTDFDIGHALFHSWIICMSYLFIKIIHTDTDVFENSLYILGFLIEFLASFITFFIWLATVYWLPFGVLTTIGLGTAHVQYKKRREQYEMIWSYVDDEEDMPVNLSDIRPQPGAKRGWGERDEEIEPVPNFVAPTKYLKISGMVGMMPGLTIPQNIGRLNQAIKEKLAPDSGNGPFPWEKVTVDTRVALIYMKLKTIEEATAVFHALDGFCFDVSGIPQAGGKSHSSCRSVKSDLINHHPL